MDKKETPKLIPAIIQDHTTKQVLMLGYMSEGSLKKSIETKRTWFYSRSRSTLWNKGETSGNFQDIKEIKYDCDKDTLLILVDQKGQACHTGNKSCFFRTLKRKDIGDIGLEFKQNTREEIISELYAVISKRIKEKVEGSYTYLLHKKGTEEVLKKLGEEAVEVIIGARYQDKERLISEIADLLYHLLVLMVEKKVLPEDVFYELRSRRK